MILRWRTISRTSVCVCCFCCVVLAISTASVCEAADPSGAATVLRPSVIIAGRYVASDGTLQSNVAVVIADGRIQEVVPAKRYEKAAGVLRRPDGVLCPGLIDVRSSIGAHEQVVETAHSIDPGASAIDSVDRLHRDFRSAVRAGITTAMLTPENNNLISGVAAVIKTAAPAAGGSGAVLRDDGPLMLALGPSVWERDRAPTSRIGSLAMLRDALGLARNGRGHERVSAFVSGTLDGIVVCDEAMDVSAALRTFRDIDGHLSIVHTSDVHDLADELEAAGRTVVVGPYSFAMTQRVLSGAAAFSSAGVPVAFAAQMPVHTGDGLRITAALAVRHGLGPAEARRAMTTTAAAVAGVGDRVGAIRAGLDADLVLFSGDPLRLDSKVVEVYVDGVRVYKQGTSAGSYAGGGP